MWFKREQKNRRLRRGHVLNVKLRSDRVNAARTRLVSVALGVTCGTAFGLYLLWRTGEWALDKFVYENSTFAIQNIEVQTDGVIAPEQLRRWTRVRPGANLIALDLASVKRNLELVSTIEAVSVERVLPHTLKVRVTERDPVAQVNVPLPGSAGGITVSTFQLDVAGCVMQPLDPRLCVVRSAPLAGELPVITGLSGTSLPPGRRVESPQVLAALALIGAFAHSPMAGLVDLRRLDVSHPGVIVATTGQGSEITFALDQLERQLARWRNIHDLGQTLSKTIASADLAVANNVPVRWQALPEAPSVAPKTSKPSKPRKRNV